MKKKKIVLTSEATMANVIRIKNVCLYKINYEINMVRVFYKGQNNPFTNVNMRCTSNHQEGLKAVRG